MDVQFCLLISVRPVVVVHPSQLVLLSLSDSTSDSTVTYAGVDFSGLSVEILLFWGVFLLK